MAEIQDKKSIRALPNEILLAIFSYLNVYDIKYNISNVCIRWSVLAKDKKLWKNLYFKTTYKAAKIFGVGSWFSTLTFLKSTPELQNIVISKGHAQEELTELLVSLNEFCPNLRHIDLEDGNSITQFKGFCNILNNLESLTLFLGPKGSQLNCFKILAEFKNLKKIGFFGNDPESKKFQKFICETPHLEHVNVSEIRFSEENFMSLWKAREKFVSFKISTNHLNENCLKLLSMFPRLNELKIVDKNLSPEKLKKIRNLKCLTSLLLEEAACSPVLTSSALCEFFHGGCFANLKELKLHKSRLEDEGAAAIRKNCINLMYLEIITYPRSVSGLSEKALVHFLHCKNLRYFEILFDNDQADWVYRRIRYVHHDCEVDDICPLGLEGLLDSWDEIYIPVD